MTGWPVIAIGVAGAYVAGKFMLAGTDVRRAVRSARRQIAQARADQEAQ